MEVSFSKTDSTSPSRRGCARARGERVRAREKKKIKKFKIHRNPSQNHRNPKAPKHQSHKEKKKDKKNNIFSTSPRVATSMCHQMAIATLPQRVTKPKKKKRENE